MSILFFGLPECYRGLDRLRLGRRFQDTRRDLRATRAAAIKSFTRKIFFFGRTDPRVSYRLRQINDLQPEDSKKTEIILEIGLIQDRINYRVKL